MSLQIFQSLLFLLLRTSAAPGKGTVAGDVQFYILTLLEIAVRIGPEQFRDPVTLTSLLDERMPAEELAPPVEVQQLGEAQFHPHGLQHYLLKDGRVYFRRAFSLSFQFAKPVPEVDSVGVDAVGCSDEMVFEFCPSDVRVFLEL